MMRTQSPDESAGNPSPTIALMYHAIGGGGADGAEDPHYSVSLDRFEAHLDAIAACTGEGTSALDWLEHPRRAALLTFDDGHVSNHRLAWPALAKRGMRADFFVNPARVGERGFVSWSDLREMSDDGMSIQSHGWNHRYFTALSSADLRSDLVRSRRTIEESLGRPVTLLAPPGGRMHADLPQVAQECGYRHVLGSQPGRIRAAQPLLPRMAVTAALDERTLTGWIAGRGIARARVRYAVLGLAKSALGDRRYERVRERLLGQAGSNV
jgi:peptidoglycan/xylan/chitin deacetylase (PgdA/CDA1 family)